jgi:hypothetical protein
MSTLNHETGRWESGSRHAIVDQALQVHPGPMGRVHLAHGAALFYAFIMGGQGVSSTDLTPDFSASKSYAFNALTAHAGESQIEWAITVLTHFFNDLDEHGDVERIMVKEIFGNLFDWAEQQRGEWVDDGDEEEDFFGDDAVVEEEDTLTEDDDDDEEDWDEDDDDDEEAAAQAIVDELAREAEQNAYAATIERHNARGRQQRIPGGVLTLADLTQGPTPSGGLVDAHGNLFK